MGGGSSTKFARDKMLKTGIRNQEYAFMLKSIVYVYIGGGIIGAGIRVSIYPVPVKPVHKGDLEKVEPSRSGEETMVVLSSLHLWIGRFQNCQKCCAQDKLYIHGGEWIE
ncbi:hypothetical protein BSKO_08121 [Bryopsis sp. KO-2023]|nr:hypothetical protein BSKO_08121 [Bryopsis sp. KO-2023]